MPPTLTGCSRDEEGISPTRETSVLRPIRLGDVKYRDLNGRQDFNDDNDKGIWQPTVPGDHLLDGFFTNTKGFVSLPVCRSSVYNYHPSRCVPGPGCSGLPIEHWSEDISILRPVLSLPALCFRCGNNNTKSKCLRCATASVKTATGIHQECAFPCLGNQPRLFTVQVKIGPGEGSVFWILAQRKITRIPVQLQLNSKRP